MKKRMILLIWCVLLILCGCSSKTMPAEYPTTVPTEAAAESVETAPAEPEKIEELVVSEDYYFSLYDGDILHQRYITIYPNSGFYSAQWKGDDSRGTYVPDNEGRISMDIGGEPCVFRKTDHSLILESGSFQIYSDTGSVEIMPGAVSKNRTAGTLRGGVYVLEASGYDFTFDEVLMELDLTDMTFALKCFDGSVVSGTLSFEESHLVCTHPGGRMMLSVMGSGSGIRLEDKKTSLKKGIELADQLMFCPQADSSMVYTFVYAEDQEQEIAADPEAIPLDSFKKVYKENYQFRCYVEKEGENRLCVFDIYHYPLEGKWEFYGTSERFTVEAEEKPDGSIVFSGNGKQWNFRREEDHLCYEGGSSLTAGSWNIEEGAFTETQVPEGAAFYAGRSDYLYDGLYILPYETLDTAYSSVQIDTENQYLWLRTYDGILLEGPYTYEGDYLNFPCEVPGPLGPEIFNFTLFPHEHSLSVRNCGMRDVWAITMAPGDISDNFHLFPVKGAEPQETVEE